jgi:hypothetical protein
LRFLRCIDAIDHELADDGLVELRIPGSMLPIPLKLVRAGVRDMVRISDARMRGTAYGAFDVALAAGALAEPAIH